MNRRSWLKSLALFSAGGIGASSWMARAASNAGGSGKGTIVLYCDLAVDPAREQEMLDAYHEQFKPTAEKHEGYVDLKMLKINKVIQGRPAPAKNINYRFQLTYRSEALRRKWIASADHQRVWPLIENTVTNKDYLVLLTDSI
jgi:hypothetical protein